MAGSRCCGSAGPSCGRRGRSHSSHKEESVTLKGSCLCGAVRYEVDRLDTPSVIVTARPVARRMRLHMRRPRGSCGIISVWSPVRKNLRPSNRRPAKCGDSALCAAPTSWPTVRISRMSCFALQPSTMIRRSGRLCTSGPRMMCRGSPKGKICHAFQSGHPAANVTAPSLAHLTTPAPPPAPSRSRADPATTGAYRTASATDRPGGRWQARGSRACRYRSRTTCRASA